MRVLTINAGSSSVRLAALDSRSTAAHRALLELTTADDPIPALLRQFLAQAGSDWRAVAHRVVHGGERLVHSCRITADVEQEIERAAAFAPLHNPTALTWIRAARQVLGEIPQVAVFDTAFYADLPAVARTYALPPALNAASEVRRYGFHGLAHSALWRRWCELEPDRAKGSRVISLQLGSGCSITAMRAGRPVDTSMGFTPLEGLVMATRSGDVDPGLLLYLQRVHSIAPDRMERILNQDSGLLGISRVSSDMRALLASGDVAARLAVGLFCYRARKYVGAYLAVLGGADAILFGGGIGEHTPEVRERILAGMSWAGIILDDAANQRAVGSEARLNAAHRPADQASIWVIPVDEAHILAEEANAVMAADMES